MMDSVKQTCRLCLATSPDQYSLITDSAMRSKLDVVFKFELPFNDVLPAVACLECSGKIDEFYSFHETVRTNQDMFSLSNANILLLVEVKGEPADGGEEDPMDFTAVDQNNEDENDTDHHRSEKSDLQEPRDIVEKEKVPNEKTKRSIEDNLAIEQFFNGRIPCSICSAVSQTFEQLKAHGKKVHGTNASVKCCKRKYSKKCELVEHLTASHLNPNTFYCKLCKKNYGSKHSLDVHNLKIHNPERLCYPCTECSRRFPKEHFLKTHLKSHVRVQCTVCNRTMANTYSLKLHMQTHSERQRENPSLHICDSCGKSYHQKQGLERHINTVHLGIKDADRIQCPQCKEWFSTNYLRSHVRIAHGGDNQRVTCSICQQEYANKRALSDHKSNVHKDKKLDCDICGKTFKKPTSLKEHLAAHMGQRLYSCTVCGYSSNSNGNLYGHMKNKHPAEWANVKNTGGSLLARHSEPMETE